MTQRYTIQNIGNHTFIYGPRSPELDIATRAARGKITRDGYQISTIRSSDIVTIANNINDIFANITPAPAVDITPADAKPAADTPQTRPSSPAHPAKDHPLGRAIRRETGCTVYSDDTFGGGTVRIYDES